jgi:hypothetical protein
VCELSDPDNTSDVCADVNKNKGVGFGQRPGNFSAGLMFQPDAFAAPGVGRPFGGSANQMRRTR